MAGNTAKEVTAACGRVLEQWRGRGVAAVYIYGSILGPRHRADSDVDVAVLDLEQQPLNWAGQSRLMDDLERAVGKPIDLRMLRSCVISLQAHILERGKPIWVEHPAVADDYAKDVRKKYETLREKNQKAWSSTLRGLAAKIATQNEPRVSR